MAPEVSNNLTSITMLCEQMQVKSLYLFGSAASSKSLGPESDIDFLLSYKKDTNGLPLSQFDYFELLFALERITGRKIDLVVEDTIRNPYFKKTSDQNKIMIYEA